MGIFFVFQPFEKPRGYPGYDEVDDEKEDQYGYAKPCPQAVRSAFGLDARDGGENDEHGRIREDRATDGHGHWVILCYTQPAHNRIRDQRVGGEHAGGKQARVETVSEQVVAHRKAKQNGE